MADLSVRPKPASVRLTIVPDEPDDGLLVFANMRPRLIGIARRILGRVAEVEDIVQDVWVRWQSTNRKAVQSPPAFLTTTATRLCINLLQSARSRHETCIGARLPEPVDSTSDPTVDAERGEALKLAVLTVLEKLTPTERAAYVLREAFDYSYDEIAGILRLEEVNTRKLVSRARKHIADVKCAHADPGEQRRLLEAFILAAQTGDMEALEGLLAADVDSHSTTIRMCVWREFEEVAGPSRKSLPHFPHVSGRATHSHWSRQTDREYTLIA
jgi:RNA polymerase sigma-70 factor (ECF subfamily)